MKEQNGKGKSDSVKFTQRKRKPNRTLQKRLLTLLFMVLAAAFILIIKDVITQRNDPTDIIQKYGSGSSGFGESPAWALVLVNRDNPIADGYELELTELPNGECVDSRIYPALREMLDAAQKEGIYPIVVDGYRTAEKQQSLMDQKIDEYTAQGCTASEAKEKAEAWVAIPGTSEHQLGIAVDINSDGIHQAGDDVYNWLYKNSYEYGFILRYPFDKTDITGTIYEPWHYRYVGVEAAKEIYGSGLCLEEYLNRTQ